jgi:hypothetical protein
MCETAWTQSAPTSPPLRGEDVGDNGKWFSIRDGELRTVASHRRRMGLAIGAGLVVAVLGLFFGMAVGGTDQTPQVITTTLPSKTTTLRGSTRVVTVRRHGRDVRVTVTGQTRTVTGPTRRIVVSKTSTDTVVQTQVQLRNRTVTGPARTVVTPGATVVTPGQPVLRDVTTPGPESTVTEVRELTLPAQTVTQQVTQEVTLPERTVTNTVTETVPLVAVTVTVTVPVTVPSPPTGP